MSSVDYIGSLVQSAKHPGDYIWGLSTSFSQTKSIYLTEWARSTAQIKLGLHGERVGKGGDWGLHEFWLALFWWVYAVTGLITVWHLYNLLHSCRHYNNVHRLHDKILLHSSLRVLKDFIHLQHFLHGWLLWQLLWQLLRLDPSPWRFCLQLHQQLWPSTWKWSGGAISKVVISK